MRCKLDRRWIDHLLGLPESGMGYQRVDVRLHDGRELRNLLVFNAEEIETPEPLSVEDIADIHLHAA
jgi:hypothetical protein